MMARAQQAAVPVVGFVSAGSVDVLAGYASAFRKGLGETGYIDGQNVNRRVPLARGSTRSPAGDDG
jgi:putative ABC transport system substrate-binding protein